MSQRSCLAFVKFPCLCCLVVLGSLYLNFVPKYCFSCPCGVSYVGNVSSQISTRSLLLFVLRKTSFVVFWFWCPCYETLTCLRGMLHLPQSSPAYQLESFVKVKVKISPSLLLHSKVISTAQLLDHLGCGLSKFLSNGRHQISKSLGQLALPILQVVVLGGQ